MLENKNNFKVIHSFFFIVSPRTFQTTLVWKDRHLLYSSMSAPTYFYYAAPNSRWDSAQGLRTAYSRRRSRRMRERRRRRSKRRIRGLFTIIIIAFVRKDS